MRSSCTVGGRGRLRESAILVALIGLRILSEGLDVLALEMEKLVAANARLQEQLDRFHSAPDQGEQHADTGAVQSEGERVQPAVNDSASALHSSGQPPPGG